MCMCVCTCPWKPKTVLGPLELELKAVVSYPTWNQLVGNQTLDLRQAAKLYSSSMGWVGSSPGEDPGTPGISLGLAKGT